ncbi:alpha/beta fold hydrolase [Dietzia sp. 179-F 9C3 NHS]|uniref:alpha/beta fold hydrolase n=1 Tax=Dietzia sp. 179-F 9C3 NHS TaxID=3374295 RepID=UPI003879D95C
MNTAELVNYSVEGQGPALVMLHGFFMSTALFDGQAERFKATHTVVRIDSRGHGQTPHGRAAYSFWDQAEDVRAVLDAEGIDSAVVVGHSQGGFIALRLALAHPERVRGLVLIASESGPSPEPEQRGYQELFAAWDAHGPVPELTGPLAAQIIGDPQVAERWSTYWQSRKGIPVGPAGDCLLHRDDITDRLGEIVCPALMIRGSLDQAIDAERAQPLIDGLPGLEAAVTVPGAAHAPHVTHPHVCDPAMEVFLDALDRCGRD